MFFGVYLVVGGAKLEVSNLIIVAVHLMVFFLVFVGLDTWDNRHTVSHVSGVQN